MLVGGLIAVLIEILAMRTIRLKEGPIAYFFVTSISASTAAQFLVLATIGGTYYSWHNIVPTASVHIGAVSISVLNILMGGSCVLALLILNVILFRTRIGMAIRAAACDLRAAALMGVNINQVISFVFFLSGAMGGLVGTLRGIAYTTHPLMGPEAMMKGFVAAVVGGLGSMSGAVVGGMLLALIETAVITSPLGSQVAPIVVFGLLLIVLFVRPTGIAGKRTEEKA
jgi:branched-chain amino acid transport system permease protein